MCLWALVLVPVLVLNIAKSHLEGAPAAVEDEDGRDAVAMEEVEAPPDVPPGGVQPGGRRQAQRDLPGAHVGGLSLWLMGLFCDGGEWMMSRGGKERERKGTPG